MTVQKMLNGKGYCFVPVKAKNNKMSEWNLISTSVKLLRRRWGFIAVSCQAWRVILWLMSFQWFKSDYSLSLDRTNKSSQICLWETLQKWRSLWGHFYVQAWRKWHYQATTTFTALVEWQGLSERNGVV